MSNKIILQTIEVISEKFELKEKSVEYTELRNRLSEKIKYLIEKDFERLLQILYRIDVDEEKAKKCLSENPPSQAHFVLADLIIERQMQKIKTREQFGKK